MTLATHQIHIFSLLQLLGIPGEVVNNSTEEIPVSSYGQIDGLALDALNKLYNPEWENYIAIEKTELLVRFITFIGKFRIDIVYKQQTNQYKLLVINELYGNEKIEQFHHCGLMDPIQFLSTLIEKIKEEGKKEVPSQPNPEE